MSADLDEFDAALDDVMRAMDDEFVTDGGHPRVDLTAVGVTYEPLESLPGERDGTDVCIAEGCDRTDDLALVTRSELPPERSGIYCSDCASAFLGWGGDE